MGIGRIIALSGSRSPLGCWRLAGRTRVGASSGARDSSSAIGHSDRTTAVGRPAAGRSRRPLRAARDEHLRAFERAYLQQALAAAGNNVTAAARIAGIDRIYFYRLLWKYGLR